MVWQSEHWPGQWPSMLWQELQSLSPLWSTSVTFQLVTA
jgi:hypothetical protein